MKLSIIIPYYNAEPHTSEILDRLDPQMRDDVEVFVVDDGSPKPFKTDYVWCKVIRKKNGGCCTARNVGIEMSMGEYITFIDADDMVATYYVERILQQIRNGADVIEMSWKSLTTAGQQYNVKLNSKSDRLWNPAVWCRVFKRSFIGDVRFNENKDSTEDEDFVRHLRCLDKDAPFKRDVITDYMYFYRSDDMDAKHYRFKRGLMKTKRIVYYYNTVSSDRIDILEAIKKDDEHNEVWLLTNRCNIPELKLHCQISKPINLWCHELKGEPYSKCTIITPPLKVDVVMYCEYTTPVGGIGTFIYNFCKNMADRIDMIVLHDKMDPRQVARLSGVVRVYRNNPKLQIECDTIITNRMTDHIPSCVKYKKSIGINHACKLAMRVPDRDFTVNVSQAAKDSWGYEAKDNVVIHNFTYLEVPELMCLVSATRIGTSDKGDNEKRFKILANKLEQSGLPWIWLNFSDKPLTGMPSRFINMHPELNIQNYIRRATYLVQLSDKESFSYSIMEALTNGTPVICTPMPVIEEIGVVDGVNAHVVPYNMDFDVRILLDVPEFEFQHDNEVIAKQWLKLLKRKAAGRKDNRVKVKIIRRYKDIDLNRVLYPGDVVLMTKERADYIVDTKKYATRY